MNEELKQDGISEAEAAAGENNGFLQAQGTEQENPETLKDQSTEQENPETLQAQGTEQENPETLKDQSAEQENQEPLRENEPKEESTEAPRENAAGGEAPEKPAEPAKEENTETPENGNGGKKKKKKEKKSLLGEILDWVVTLLVAVVAALVIRSLLFEPIRVDGASMNDTLADGEVMFVSKLDYASTWLSFPWQSEEAKESAPRITTGLGAPARFDVIITRYPGRGDTNFVKRLIGMPGDRVKIEDGYLYVNDEKYEEPYINDAYRVSGGSNGMSFEEVYIPKKGDALSLEYTDENKNRIVLCVNGEPWVWRGISSAAVAADGDRLTYTKDGTLTLNGEEITSDTDRIVSLVGKQFSLEQDLYFVMGDHRNNSNDSRAQGPITRDMIVGHVRFVFFPFGAMRGVE